MNTYFTKANADWYDDYDEILERKYYYDGMTTYTLSKYQTHTKYEVDSL